MTNDVTRLVANETEIVDDVDDYDDDDGVDSMANVYMN